MIDIIIPIYNASNYLDRLLESIKKQTYKDYSIYLIDANSTEEYNLDKYDLNITYYKLNEQTCPGLTRQVGIDKSEHDYIMFIDQDDELITEDSLQTLIDNIDECDIVACGEYFEKEKREMINDISLHGKLFRRSFLESNNIRFNDFIYHEDLYFNNYCYLKNARVKNVNKVIYYYHDNPSSIVNQTDSIEIKKMEYIVKTISELKRLIPIKDNIIGYRKFIYNNYDYFIRMFNILDEREKELLASYIKKYDKEDIPLMLSKSNIELREKINEMYK